MSTPIGERLKAAREAKGLSVGQLAKAAVIMEHRIEEWEKIDDFISDMDPNGIVAICRALSISPAWLLGMTDKTPEEWWESRIWCASNWNNERAAKEAYLASHGLPAPGRSSE